MRTDFYRITNAEGKTWLMPAKDMRVAMELYQPSGRNGKWLKRGFPWLHGLKVVRKALHVDCVPAPWGEAFRQRMEQLFGGKDLAYAVFCGTPCVHQKMTVQLNRGKQILGYCKASDNPEVAALFHREEQVLRTLEQWGMTDIPRCLYVGEEGEHGRTLFVQSTTKTLHSQVVHEWSPLHTDFLERMQRCSARTLPFEESDYYATLQALKTHADWLPEGVDKARVGKVCDRILRQWQGKEVTFSAYHADFTPWNMFVEQERLFVFDWEYAQLTYPSDLDRYHFFTQTAFFEKHWQLEDFVRYLQSPRANWVDRETYTYYILDIIARFTLREKGKVDGDVKRLMKLWNGLLIQLAHC